MTHEALLELIRSWTSMPETSLGLAEDLRSAAMEAQEDYQGVTSKAFQLAAAELGFNAKTASRCWSFVAAQK